MILLAFLLGVSGAALEVGLEVGWAGQPVLSVVNPLWLTLSNPSPQPFSGEVHIRGTAGSPWRGEAVRTAVIPVFLGAWGRTVWVLPWSIYQGMTTIQVRVFSRGTEVFAREFSLQVEALRLPGKIGPPGFWSGIVISPTDFPQDPLLLWPFAELEISGPLAPEGKEVIRAWQAFLGGRSALGPTGVASIQAEPFRQRLSLLRPVPPIWSILIPGLILYLVALGPGLGRMVRGRSGLLCAVVLAFLGLSLFYSLSRESAEQLSSIAIRISSRSVQRFYLEICGLISWRLGEIALPGWWHELLPHRGWRGLDLRWEYGPDGWTTVVPLQPGIPRVLLRVVPEEARVMRGEPVPPPPWLWETLDLPWGEALLRRLPTAPREAEAFWIELP